MQRAQQADLPTGINKPTIFAVQSSAYLCGCGGADVDANLLRCDLAVHARVEHTERLQQLSATHRKYSVVVKYARQPHHLGDKDDILSVRPSSECHRTETTSRTSVGGRKELLCEVPMTQCPPLQPCMKPPFAAAVDTAAAMQLRRLRERLFVAKQ
eukprot:COSAG02_NODE_1124_length_14441_cov_21.457607_13_plen_156_part_00